MSLIQDFLVLLGADAFLKAFQDNRPFLIPGNAAKIETLFGGPMGKNELFELLERAQGISDFDAEPPPQIDPRFLPFARELLRQTSFTARDSLSWASPDGHPYTWDEIVPMLDGLLSVGILTRR